MQRKFNLSPMPVSRNALLRYKTIDKCLRNRGRLWTLEDLIEACSEALYDYEGIDKPVSKRTVQLDIQKMRSSELGYYAPIVVTENKYYTYEDPEYSITNVPISDDDLRQMSEAVEVLKQMSGFSSFEGIEDIVNRLEDHVLSMRHHSDPVILLETNERLKGLHYISPFHKAITDHQAVRVTYRSFKSDSDHSFVFSPYVLKEYRNRWFVFGRRDRGRKEVENLALDRIQRIEIHESDPFLSDPSFKPSEYFKNIVGVTLNNTPVITIRFSATKEQAPYIRTKPIHSSQLEIESDAKDGSAIFQIQAIVNNELIREFVGYGEGVKVLSPHSFVSMIKKKLRSAADQYDSI